MVHIIFIYKIYSNSYQHYEQGFQQLFPVDLRKTGLIFLSSPLRNKFCYNKETLRNLHNIELL